jgi:hypothetical protein
MTKEIGVSRRNALVMAGTGAAGLALAACNKEGAGGATRPELGAKKTSALVSEFLAEQGLENHGDVASAPPPGPVPAYKPNFMQLIHLKSNGPWELTSNHAHFEFVQPTYDKAARIKRATQIFANKVQKGHSRFKAEPRGSNFQVHDRQPNDPTPDFADSMNFAEFNFGQQHDMYIFFEHKPNEISFDTANKNFVIFSSKFLNGTATDENRAFFNAELITDPATLGPLNGKGSLMRMDNFYTAKPGSSYIPIAPSGPVKSQVYKMNFVYVTSTGIVMLVDPDTGNGIGSGP